MISAILGTKKELSQVFLADGTRIPVTKVQAGPCLVTQIKSRKKDGYQAIQLGLGRKKLKKVSKPLTGHLKNSTWPEKGKDKMLPRVLKEVKITGDLDPTLKVGDVISANQILTPGDVINVTGISRGKGFTGVMKRWGFKGGPKTHGQSDRERAPGSIGQSTRPGRVFKGKKMAGRSGGALLTIRNLTILKVTQEGEVWITGQVPGSRNGLLTIKRVGKAENFKGLYKEVEKEGEEAREAKKQDSKKKEKEPKK